MKTRLYLVITNSHTAGFNGSTDTIEVIEGIFKNKQKAQKLVDKLELAYIRSIKTDLFESEEE